jgi:hypothetical protein
MGEALERQGVGLVLVGMELDRLGWGRPWRCSSRARVRFWLAVMAPLRRSSESVKP